MPIPFFPCIHIHTSPFRNTVQISSKQTASSFSSARALGAGEGEPSDDEADSGGRSARVSSSPQAQRGLGARGCARFFRVTIGTDTWLLLQCYLCLVYTCSIHTHMLTFTYISIVYILHISYQYTSMKLSIQSTSKQIKQICMHTQTYTPYNNVPSK